MTMPQRQGRGRQLEARRNDRALLDAARQVFAVHGPEAPVSAVAQAAGVGIASLYRRYATKDVLLQQLCQASMEQQVAAAQAALVGGANHWENLAGYIRACISFRAGLFGTVAGTIPVTSEMIATADHAHQLVAELVRRAQRTDSLRPDVNAVDVVELVALFSRRPATDDASTRRLIEIALDGLRAHGQPPLADAAIAWEEQARRWSFRRQSPSGDADPCGYDP